jgi:hypothetical protein
MDLSRAQELEEAILSGVRAHYSTRTICLFDPEVDSIVGGRRLFAGWYDCEITLRPVSPFTGRHTLQLRSDALELKVFRETRGGWFAIRSVVDHVVLAFAAEAKAKQAQRRTGQLLAGARNRIKRLSNQVPEFQLNELELLLNTEQPGTIDVLLRGLEESSVLKLVSALRDLGLVTPKTKPRKDLWSHLKDV